MGLGGGGGCGKGMKVLAANLTFDQTTDDIIHIPLLRDVCRKARLGVSAFDHVIPKCRPGHVFRSKE